MAIYECKKCMDVFEGDGLHVIVHEKSAGRVCPACLVNAERITVIIERLRPGKPYTIKYVEVEFPPPEENDVLPSKT